MEDIESTTRTGERAKMNTAAWEVIQFKGNGDERGQLVALESDINVPFQIKRVYYLIQTCEGVRRGFHAHQKLDQILIAVSGSCRVSVDDGIRKEEFLLNDCKTGLRIRDLVWREMSEFSPDCVLLVLASDLYNEKDYIRNYDRFLEAVRIQNSGRTW